MYKSIRAATDTILRYQQSRAKFTQLVNIAVNNEGISTITIQRNPVNALSMELLTELRDALESVENNQVRGLLLTSGNKHVFSAGLDIRELYKPKVERFKQYWNCFKDVLMKLTIIDMPTAAVVNGHVIAGGCLLPLCCEYRVMVTGYTIGMNETKLGIAIPSWAYSIFASVCSRRQAELALTTGVLSTAEEALTAGIVDQIASDESDARIKCELFLKRFDFTTRNLSKYAMKASVIESLKKQRNEDIESVFASLDNPIVQQRLQKFIK